MSITVSGYASLDHAMLVDRVATADETGLVRRRLSSRWPAPGGAAYLAAACDRAGGTPTLVTWLGHDNDGDAYLASLSGTHIDLSAVDRDGTQSPASWLFYDADGHAACYFDPGQVADTLTGAQRPLLATSTWWALTVGPASVTEEVLRAAENGLRLVWVVKADPDAFPPHLVRRLLEQSALVIHSRGERDFLSRMTGADDPHTLLADQACYIETNGSDGVRYLGPDGHGTVEVDPLPLTDTTGAGDTLAGTVVAAIARGAPLVEATAEGARAAHTFLMTRLKNEHE